MIVLVHAGICDASMWDDFDLPGAERHEVRGFGNTPLPESGEVSDADDLEARLSDGPAALVGASFGGQVCLEVAARRPELVSELVLLASRVPDHEWSDEIILFAEEEDRLLEEGDLNAAADLNARFWAPSVADRVPDFRAIAARLAYEIPGAELVTMPGVTHLPSLERPEGTAELVRGFLGR